MTLPEGQGLSEGTGETKPRSALSWLLWGILALAFAIVPRLLWGPLNDTRKEFYGHRMLPAKAAAGFELTDHRGKPVRLSDFKGKVVLMCFGFTNCPNICPTTLTSLNNIYQLLPPADRDRVQVVFISVDPKRDTPDRLSKYVPFFNPAFLGATSSEDYIRKLAREYGAFFEYKPQPTNEAKDYYTVTHSAYTYLIDPMGRLAVLYSYEILAEAGKVVGDIQKILQLKS